MRSKRITTAVPALMTNPRTSSSGNGSSLGDCPSITDPLAGGAVHTVTAETRPWNRNKTPEHSHACCASNFSMTKKITTEHVEFTCFHDLALHAAEALRTGNHLEVDPRLIVEAGDAKVFLILWKALRTRDKKS
jgi:hypothetical protein